MRFILSIDQHIIIQIYQNWMKNWWTIIYADDWTIRVSHLFVFTIAKILWKSKSRRLWTFPREVEIGRDDLISDEARLYYLASNLQ